MRTMSEEREPSEENLNKAKKFVAQGIRRGLSASQKQQAPRGGWMRGGRE